MSDDKKHPLGHNWTWWFDNSSSKQRADDYGQNFKAVYTFSTVEDFWCLYDNLRPPSKLQPSATYFVFKENISPKWEDPACAQGGVWTANVPKSSQAKDTLDTWWLYAVLAVIGEQFEDMDEICGVLVKNRRAMERIELWTKTSANQAVQERIARSLKAALELPDSVHIGYVAFEDKRKQTLYNKNSDKYTV